MSIKGTMLLAVSSFVAIILVAFLFFQFASTRHEEDMLISKELGNLKQLITDAVRLLDAYAVTGNEDYRKDFEKTVRGISENLKVLEGHFGEEVKRVRDSVERAGKFASEVFEGSGGKTSEVIRKGFEAERTVLAEVERLFDKLNDRIKKEMKLGSIVNFVGLGVAVAVLVVGMWILYRISRGFDEVLRGTEKFGEMDLTVDLKRSGVKELDQMMNVMEFLSKGWSAFVSRFLAMVRILDGTLSKMLGKVGEFVEGTNRLKDLINGFVETSLDVAGEMEKLTEEVMDMVSQVEEEINSIESDTIRERENISRIKKTLDRVGVMMDKVGQMGKRMDEVQNYVREMVKMSEEIEDFVESVASIADQTNLLALNAAIEAARAGEAGRGFAVVAEEVRKLAGESRRATEEISNVTREIVSNIEKASNGFDSLKGEFQIIRTEFEDLKEAFQESGERLENMAESLTGITSRLRSFLGMLRSSAESVERASESSREVAEKARSSSEVLDDMIIQLRAMEKFTLVRDMFNQLASQMERIKVKELKLDPEKIFRSKKDVERIFAGMEQVLGMTGFFIKGDGTPFESPKHLNPVCSAVEGSDCARSRIKLLEKFKGDYAFGVCHAGMMYALIPLKDESGSIVGAISMCGALPKDWKERLSDYSKISGLPESELERSFKTRFTFNEEEMKDLASTILKYLKSL